METAVFGGGCFWCTEAIFEAIAGVDSVTSGYCGGEVAFPSYEQVASGQSGHAEVVRVEFDPGTISYYSLLEIFLLTHDPTTLNRQGGDVGNQYRSVIFAQSDEQERAARSILADAENSGIWEAALVTEIDGAKPFYPATIDHQAYYRHHRHEPYCALVISPKLAVLSDHFGAKLKRNFSVSRK